MKRLVCLFLSLLLCGCMAAAETPPETAHSFITETATFDQDCYVHFQLIFEQPSGDTKEVVLSVKAFTVRYTFDIYRDAADGSYAGFSYDRDKVVTLLSKSPAADNIFLPLLDLTIDVEEVPQGYSFSGSPDDYTITVTGGQMIVNYNSSLHFNLAGELIETIPTTQERAFFYSNVPYPIITDQQ